MFFLLPCICFGIKYGLAHTPYAFKYSEWISVLSHIWLLYYYVSLALRENILKVVRLCALCASAFGGRC